MSSPRLEQAIASIDAANADDPNTLVVDGAEVPKEQAHAEMVTTWIRTLVTEPGEELLLAARAHHLKRWAVPRSSYPLGRAGYLKWRRELHHRHAEDVGAILGDTGYPEAAIARVQDLVQKKGLGRVDDPEVQALEDAVCLVFIETQFGELAARLDRQYGDADKMVEVVRKTLAKMSDAGRRHALGIDLSAPDRAIVEAALAADDGQDR